jgi:hypothetical protein
MFACRPGGVRCHTGPVEVLLHDTQTNYLLSGGGDGLIQLWDVAKVQEAEPPEGSNTVEIKPAVSVTLPTCSSSRNSSSSGRSSSGATRDGSAGVRGLVWLDRRTWLVQSEAGALFKVNARQLLAATTAPSAVSMEWFKHSKVCMKVGSL